MDEFTRVSSCPQPPKGGATGSLPHPEGTAVGVVVPGLLSDGDTAWSDADCTLPLVDIVVVTSAYFHVKCNIFIRKFQS